MTTYHTSFFMDPTIDLLIQHHPSIWFYPFNHSSPVESLSMVLTLCLLTGRQVRRFIYQGLDGKTGRNKERIVKVRGFLLTFYLLSNTWSVWSLGFHLPTMSSWGKKKEVEQLFFLSLWSVKHQNVSLCLLWRQESLALRGLGHLMIESFNFFCSRCFLCSGHGFGLSQTERERLDKGLRDLSKD